MKYKILIVEDNGPILENTTELLELSNYSVLSARNGKEGLDAALQEAPDLILCDIRMPFIDGFHLLELVRQQPSLNSSHFVFFTASCEKKEIEKGMAMGADDYIIKPFTGEELLERIQKVLD